MSKTKTKTKTPPPTTSQFAAYEAMYAYFNARLFAGELAPVLLNFSRKAGTLGFFAPGRWVSGEATTHEISLNPSHLRARGPEDTASTLVHEMAHAWQAQHGKPGRAGYHNEEWAAKMESVGLVPSDTGAAGGKRVGDRMSHYIAEDGAFRRAFARLPKSALLPWTSQDPDVAKPKTRPASKVKFTCPGCESNAWGKPGLHLVCGDCREVMEPGEATG